MRKEFLFFPFSSSLHLSFGLSLFDHLTQVLSEGERGHTKNEQSSLWGENFSSSLSLPPSISRSVSHSLILSHRSTWREREDRQKMSRLIYEKRISLLLFLFPLPSLILSLTLWWSHIDPLGGRERTDQKWADLFMRGEFLCFPFSSSLHLSFSLPLSDDLTQIHFDRKNPAPPGGFPIYYVPSSRTVSKRTPLEEPGTNPSRGVLLLTVFDEGT